MPDRPPPHARPGTNRTARANTAGIRRNLFQNQLTRRPTPTTTTTAAAAAAAMATTTSSSQSSANSNNSAETLRLGDVEVLSDTSDIVVRDKNGEFDVGDPPTPPLDDPEEAGGPGPGALDDAQENERERQRLAEAVKHYQVNLNRTPAQPEEILETLRASMRAKVAALAEDNWMYEPEEQQRPQ
ncbi:uncharacterized protein F4812DRAFT_368360 [Daldinia caldariorum]|uniref:uncharacterized protein n=1 Tax=Daldinia caldariorum TaxID=326644 RepID=UPI0020076A17|nr:uncharacterized protein F4812DRAFT_368360 [Daldinia caldariorum]KAI1468430.1 hypothetical protein F4812DRAFT_368360 [Daldinia caldariorum]